MRVVEIALFLIILQIYFFETSSLPNGVKKIKTKPKVFGDKIPYRSLQPKYKKVQEKIVSVHNYFRSRVKPQAANMLRMKWHKGAAQLAQKWASSCVKLKHDNGALRTVPSLGGCGQNIFISGQKMSWFFAIKSWYDEREDFIFGNNNHTAVVGHYTQLVWAASHKVGCGFAICGSSKTQIWYNYVCNYCPGGNYKSKLGKPYKKGKPCSDCPGKCSKNLCLNPCFYINEYSNCDDLTSRIKNSCKKGSDYRNACRASCSCKNKIYDKFP